MLQAQRATCFEFATLLCSLLLGAHYDAYCVSGYAVKEMCLLDQSLQECPLLDTEVKVGASPGAVYVTAVNGLYPHSQQSDGSLAHRYYCVCLVVLLICICRL